ncbi:hypothetical protein LTR66_009415 [Elasticomyces elasticus]|nr:hypothetical protein LTR66_009415 [Elasticomyces elasticus]
MKVDAYSVSRYNSLFPSHTAGFEGRYGGGYWTRHLGLWPGPRHTLEFANGTELVVETTASLSMDGFEDIIDGNSLFQAACLPDSDKGYVVPHPTPRGHPGSTLPSTGPPSYPSPVLRHHNDLLRAYYLDEDEYQDTAVLQLPTFKMDGEAPKEISLTAKEFIDQAIAMGKKRLIIDLSGNGGGDINVGFNIFRLLFPRENIETRTRFRATEFIYLLGKVFSSDQARDKYENFPLDLPLAAYLAVTPDQERSFGSWEELYGSGGNEETLLSEMYASFNFSSASTESDPIEGYGTVVQTHVAQPFSTENIVMMTDGYCASTCAILADLLQGQGVRSIVFGGRPRHAPMQLLGSVRGGQYWSLRTISRYASEAYGIAVQAAQAGNPILTAHEMEQYQDLMPPPAENFSLRFDVHGSRREFSQHVW